MWKHKTPGIPDEYFDRNEDVPITKEEIRAIQITKARLEPGFTVYDLGCGSGSISIEAAIQIEKSGKVYAVDFDPKAVILTKQNATKFALDNIKIIEGNAKEKTLDLPQADAIFIGGTGGDTAEIIKTSFQKLKSGGRIVIGIILIETLAATLAVFEKLDFEDVDITQITIAKSKKTSTGTMMLSRNPVTVISATKP